MPSGQMSKALQHLRVAVRRGGEDIPDKQLLDRFLAERDEAAFEVLVRRHGPMVLGVCRRILKNGHDAEDAFQATFLVLVRKAAAIVKRETVGGFLYGVAYKTALKARAASAQRRAKERQAGQMPQREASDEESEQKLYEWLDQELSRLPDKYRIPIVLCDLEGKTRKEAAKQLGWPEGTLSGRLARARTMLAKRLTRRDLALGGGMIALGSLPNGVPACVPHPLVASTVRAASCLAAGQAAIAGANSAKAAALADGVVKGMLLAKLKIAAAVLLLAGVVGGGLLVPLALSEAPAETKPKVKDAWQPNVPEEKPRVRTDRYGDPLPPGAIARLGSLRLQHGQPVNRVVLSPDGRQVISSASDGNLLWDAVTGRQLPLREELREARIFAARGKLLAVQQRAGGLQLWDAVLWDAVAGKEIGRPLTVKEFVPSYALAPDGKTLVLCLWEIGADHLTLRFCDASKGEIGAAIRLKNGSLISQLAFSADSKTLVIQRQNFAIHVWDVPSRTEKAASRPVPADFGGFISLSPDGTILATAPLPGKRIRLWETRTFKELPPLVKQPNETVQPMTFSPDGKTLAATYAGPIARLWDLTTRKERCPIKATFQIYHTSFSADGKTLACAEHGSIRLWDVDKGEFRREHQFGHTYCIDSLHFSPDGKRLVSGAGYTDNIVRIWDPLTGEEMGQLRGHAEGIESVAYAPDGKLIASGSQDGTVRLWDAATGREVRRLDAKAGMVYALAFAPDGKTIASGDWRNGIHLWDVATGQKLRSFKNPGGVILRLAFSPDGKMLASRGGDAKEVCLWDAAKGEIIRRLMGMAAGWPSLAFSPDGKTIAAGSDDGVVRLWDVNSGAERPALVVPLRERVSTVAFSPDGRSLAVGYGEGVRLWELSSGRERACFKGHRGGITSMAFSPDGTLLASGAPDRTILVWDVTGQRTTGRRKASLTTGELTALWSDLGGADAAQAYRAVQTLLGAEEQTVPFLKAHLPPAVALDIDKKRIARLIASLDSDEFAERERAMKELRRLGERAEPALREARKGKLPLEARKRIEELLEGVRVSAASPETLRHVRAVEVLEHIGTPKARQVLVSLGKGDPEARLTREAKASLERLAKRHKPNP